MISTIDEINSLDIFQYLEELGWLNKLGSWITLQLIQAYDQYDVGSHWAGQITKKVQVIKLTSCLPMVGGSLRVFQLLPPLKLVAMI